MKRCLWAFTAFIYIFSAVSCGRTVRKAGYNPGSGNEPTAPSVFEVQEMTEAETEPPTEPPTEAYTVDPKMPEGYELPDSYAIPGFETVLQRPELPTGCEITALTQTLNYYGFDVDKTTMCDIFMPIDINGYYSMNDVYLGDPRANNGFGCNAPVIKRAADNYFASIGSDWYAMDLTGISLTEVFYQIEQGRPVVVWSTIEQRETKPAYQFTLGCGEEFYFNGYQHCLTVYGYDYNSGTVHVADPLVGNIEYNMERFERIYDVMGDQAVILCGRPEEAGMAFFDEDEQQEWLDENTPWKPKELDQLVTIEEVREKIKNGE